MGEPDHGGAGDQIRPAQRGQKEVVVALAQIDKSHGGPAALVKAKFGVTDEGIARMRQHYLV